LFKRKLPASTVFRLVTSEVENPAGPIVKRMRLKGISSLLNISIAAGLQGPEGSGSSVIYPAAPGTLNVIPFVNPPDVRAPLLLKPLSLVPQDLPHAFSIASGFVANGGPFPLAGQWGTCVCDGADIEVSVDPADYVGTGLNAVIVVVCAAEYNGSWWDIETVEQLLSRFEMDSVDPSLVGTI
jgi:hypothetical protein